MEPWEWPEGRIREATEAIRAGRPLRPSEWPGGARVAVALSFDVDHETPWLRAADVSPCSLSEGEYGSRVALPRILSILREAQCPATFFVPAVTALLHPDDVAAMVDGGHEVAAHGWIHERPDTLPPGAERELLMRTLDALEAAAGARPRGIRTPSFATSPETIALAAEAGLRYDSSLMADDDPYELLASALPTGLVEIPVDWTRDDAAYFVMDRFGSARPSPHVNDVRDLWLAEFGRARRDGGLFQLTLHPDLIGRRSRIGVLEDVLSEVVEAGDAWLATHGEVADYCWAASS